MHFFVQTIKDYISSEQKMWRAVLLMSNSQSQKTELTAFEVNSEI